ncbi:MAG: methylmalonyl Co-A mutase-associated GTPase MeaB, partial [Proteobacteria bacterium]|nr:methylmalonyl Co-A mutase-associated GTPase MeaB [Pseudomonadota bacterium]
VDPSSPFSGGALLGDRIRMNNSLSEKNIFMRSMASRGALGGISLSTPDAIAVLDAAGFNYILVETVGVGQSEVEIVKTADSVIVVLVPGMGDSVQALKAGLLEIADTFVINKADYDGVERLEKELITMLGLGENSIRTPAILKSVASKGEGIKEILLEVDKHLAWSKQSGEIVKKREQFLLQAMKRNFAYLAENQLFQQPKNTKLIQENLEKLYQRKTTPYQAATLLLKKILYRPEK